MQCHWKFGLSSWDVWFKTCQVSEGRKGCSHLVDAFEGPLGHSIQFLADSYGHQIQTEVNILRVHKDE